MGRNDLWDISLNVASKKFMKLLWFFVLLSFAFMVSAQSPNAVNVTVTVTNSPGYAIPEDFSGLSFESAHQLPNMKGVSGDLFSPTNVQLITLFRNIGLRNLRIGGGTVDGKHGARLSHTDIDNLFGFAQAADVKVIFSLPLLSANTTNDVAEAAYVLANYRPQLEWLAIGNEPDEPPYLYPPFGKGPDPTMTNYASYLPHWRRFASAVTNALPGVTFAAPDTGGSPWNTNFADDEKSSGLVSLFTTHDYFGGDWQGQTADTAVSNMLSPRWVNKRYPREFRAQSQVIADGYPYRLTELNDYLRGVYHASNAFASALWTLDVMHWWAEHGAAGVNFHNNEWFPTDTVYLDKRNRNFEPRPKAYGVKAFDLGGHGRVDPVGLTNMNTNELNLTAYAVADSTDVYVTLINKTYGTGAHKAAVTIELNGFAPGQGDVSAMYLTQEDGDVEASHGITLGGDTITNNAPWNGRWTVLGTITNGGFTVTVPAASAAVVKFVP